MKDVAAGEDKAFRTDFLANRAGLHSPPPLSEPSNLPLTHPLSHILLLLHRLKEHLHLLIRHIEIRLLPIAPALSFLAPTMQSVHMVAHCFEFVVPVDEVEVVLA